MTSWNPLFYPIVDTLKFSCQKWGLKKWSTWRTLRIPDCRHGGRGHPLHHLYNLKILQERYSEMFVLITVL